MRGRGSWGKLQEEGVKKGQGSKKEELKATESNGEKDKDDRERMNKPKERGEGG